MRLSLRLRGSETGEAGARGRVRTAEGASTEAQTGMSGRLLGGGGLEPGLEHPRLPTLQGEARAEAWWGGLGVWRGAPRGRPLLTGAGTQEDFGGSEQLLLPSPRGRRFRGTDREARESARGGALHMQGWRWGRRPGPLASAPRGVRARDGGTGGGTSGSGSRGSRAATAEGMEFVAPLWPQATHSSMQTMKPPPPPPRLNFAVSRLGGGGLGALRRGGQFDFPGLRQEWGGEGCGGSFSLGPWAGGAATGG